MTFPHAISMPVLNSIDLDEEDNSSESSTPTIARTASTMGFGDTSREDEELDLIAPHVGYKKVLVTGGAGFIGSNVAEYLLSRGDDVVVVDEINDYYDVKIKEGNLTHLRELVKGSPHRLFIYRGDICDENFMTNVFEKENPQWVPAFPYQDVKKS